MQTRQSILDLFSTFLQFDADRFGGWATDARLRRSIQTRSAQVPESQTSEQFWSAYWHQQWFGEGEIQRLALGHLSAYLQESCFWSAYKAGNRLSDSRYRISDYFQVAIAEVPRILKAKDPKHQGNLKTYATSAFGNIIRDFLRQNREVDLCSDWGLLLKLSRKRLKESLEAAGLNAETVEHYLLAWNCFETIYLPTKSAALRKLAAPDRATWDAIADLYNRQSSPKTTSKEIEAWLGLCARHSRAYLYPAVSSLNAPKPGFESAEWQDDLSDERDSLLEELIVQEDQEARQTQQGEVSQVLEDAIAKLDSTSQELLKLYYQKELTQQQIAQQLGVQQYTVSRKLSKTRETLLLALTRWSQETLHITPTSDVVKNISLVLEEWLSQRMNAGR